MNPWSLAGMSVVVTGAGRGIGAAIVAELLHHGASVLGTARPQGDLEALRIAHPEAAGRLNIFQADITLPEEREHLIAHAVKTLGGMDVLVNNAGGTFRARATDSSVDDFQRLLNLNVLAAFDLARLSHPYLRTSGRAGIVNLSSITSQVALPDRVLYGTTKAALDHLTRSLAAEWGGRGLVRTHLEGHTIGACRRPRRYCARRRVSCHARRRLHHRATARGGRWIPGERVLNHATLRSRLGGDGAFLDCALSARQQKQVRIRQLHGGERELDRGRIYVEQPGNHHRQPRLLRFQPAGVC
jgi:NAD(P)-dependent dehydrogenase (short-subunit alcohol dehydrogenase family)